MQRTDHTAPKRSPVPFLFALAGLAALVMAFYVYRTFRLDDMNLTGGTVYDYNTQWSLETGEGGRQPLALPASLAEGGGTAHITCRLPEVLPPGAVLCLQTYHQTVRAWADGQLIYTYGLQNKTSFGRMFGNVWNLIPLSSRSGGQELTLELTAAYTSSGLRIYPMLLGSRSAVLFRLLRQDLGTLAFCTGALLLAAIFLLVTLVLKLRGLDYNRRSFFYLGLFVLLAGLWVFTDSKLPQFFFHNKAPFYLLSFYAFLLLPVPLLLFLQDFCPHSRRVTAALSLATLANFAVTVVLSAADLVDILYLLGTCHLLLFITIGCCIAMCIREKHKFRNREVHLILWGVVILCVFALLALGLFYLSDNSDNSRFFRYGMLIFIALLSVSAIQHSLAILKENMTAETYRKMAYLDVMTGLANRAAFEQHMDALSAGQVAPVALLLFDLNGLKHVNDTWGHHAGDELICAAARCLRQAFDPLGVCYRIGGDEFVVLAPGRGQRDVLRALDRLSSVLEACNQGRSTPVDLAWGYAVRRGPGESMKDFFQRADDWMYRHKKHPSRP